MNRIVNWKNNDSFEEFLKVGDEIYLVCKGSLGVLK
jgi:hypothetical protein